MTVPGLEMPLTLSGFDHGWFFLYLLVVVAVAAGYVVVTRRRRKRVLLFANMSVLESVAPARATSRWRHLPAVLLVTSLVLLTTAMAGPIHDVRIPRNRAVVMLVIDVSESMIATDVAPSRIEAAKQAGKRFVDGMTAGINIGLVEFGAGATMLVAPTTEHATVDRAVDTLEPQPRTATGEGIFTALQAIATTSAVMGGGSGPPPARIVLESDGKETVPADPSEPRGAFAAAQAAKDQGVEISTIAFGTADGVIDFDGQQIPVPVDDQTLKTITEISGGQAFHADSLDALSAVYSKLQQQIGYETVRGDASAGWAALGLLVVVCGLVAGLALERRIPA
jgi:Ca-activated chloride channel family protein